MGSYSDNLDAWAENRKFLLTYLLSGINETLSFSDAFAAAIEQLKSFEDSLFQGGFGAGFDIGFDSGFGREAGAADSVDINLTYLELFTDALTLLDAHNLTLAPNINEADTLTLDDGHQLLFDYFKSFNDILSLLDADHQKISYLLTSNDSLTLSGAIALIYEYLIISNSDLNNWNDTVSFLYQNLIAKIDQLTLTENVQLGYGSSFVDQYSQDDYILVRWAYQLQMDRVDQLFLGDSLSFNLREITPEVYGGCSPISVGCTPKWYEIETEVCQ